MNRLGRYALGEVLAPLGASLLFLYLVLFAMQFLRGTVVLLGSAVTLGDFLQLVAYLTPHFLVMALPVSFLLAILLGLGRMSEDRELTAMQAVGVAPARLALPQLALGALLSVGMLLLTFTAEPYGLTAVKGLVNDIIKRNVAGDVKPGVFYEELTDLTVYAQRVDPEAGVWGGVMVYDGRDPAAPLLVLAREGVVRADPDGLKLELHDGEVHRAASAAAEYALVGFQRAELAVGLSESLARRNRFRAPKEELTPAELVAAAREADAENDPGRARGFRIALHARLGAALAPLAFALLGVPLALSGGRGRRARGFLFALAGYILYYVLARQAEILAGRGALAPHVAGYLATVVFALAGLGLLWRSSRGGGR